MTLRLIPETLKKMRYVHSFFRKKLVHTNLQLLYNCNFQCQICDFWKREYKELPKLSAAQVAIISQKLNQIGPQIVSVGGGEPLIHQELVEIVSALAKYHFPAMICNGWFVTPQLARDLFAAGMYEISVSVDYAVPHKHDAQRGMPGAFDKAVEALRILHENRVHRDQRVNMISVVMDDNLDEIGPLIEICEKMGITFLVTLYSDSRGAKDLRVGGKDFSQKLLELKQQHRHFVSLRGYLGRFSEAVHNRGIGPCYAGKNLCNIDSQGNISACIDRLQEPVGNILTEDMPSLYRKLLAHHEKMDCKACWTSCRGYFETLMYGRRKLANLWDYYQLTKPVSVGRSF